MPAFRLAPVHANGNLTGPEWHPAPATASRSAVCGPLMMSLGDRTHRGSFTDSTLSARRHRHGSRLTLGRCSTASPGGQCFGSVVLCFASICPRARIRLGLSVPIRPQQDLPVPHAGLQGHSEAQSFRHQRILGSTQPMWRRLEAAGLSFEDRPRHSIPGRRQAEESASRNRSAAQSVIPGLVREQSSRMRLHPLSGDDANLNRCLNLTPRPAGPDLLLRHVRRRNA
jgi:hypothetical protein